MSSKIKGQFFFDPDDRIYQTHFPSYPVVPGSVIIAGFVKVIKKAFPDLKSMNIKKFRFRNFVNPGTYLYQVDIKNNQLTCTLFNKDMVMAKGKINIDKISIFCRQNGQIHK